MDRKQFLRLFMSSKNKKQQKWWEEFGVRCEYITISNQNNILPNLTFTEVSRIIDKVAIIGNIPISGVYGLVGGAYRNLYYGVGDSNKFICGNKFNGLVADNEIHRWDIRRDERRGYIDGISFPERTYVLDLKTSIGFNGVYNDASKVTDFPLSNNKYEVSFYDNDGNMFKHYIPIQVIKQFTDLNGVTHSVGSYIMVNELISRDVPTHIGKFTGKQLLDGRNPVIDGLTHWWDSRNQSGTTWKPKIGNVNINTSDSWENGYFKKLPNNICETGQFNVNWAKGCTLDILYNQLVFPITGSDTQLWSFNNQSNQEWTLHYTSGKRSSFYSPVLFNNVPRYGNNLIPLNDFTSDVFIYNGNTKINNYINNKITTFTSGNTVLNNKPGAVRFALKRLASGTNNQTSLVKSIRIYNKPLTEEEVENNRLYDLYVLNKPIYEELESIEANGKQWIDTGAYGDETTELGLEFSLTQLNQQKIAGSRLSANSGNITFSYPTNAANNYFNIDFQNNVYNRVDTDYPFIVDKYYTAIASPTIMSIDGYEQEVKDVTPFVTPTTLRIGDGFGLSYANNTMSGRIKRYWIKNSNVFIQDCIPVRMLDDVGGGVAGEVGMWDKINNKFYKSETGTPFIPRIKSEI